jgi:hypothetical protein
MFVVCYVNVIVRYQNTDHWTSIIKAICYIGKILNVRAVAHDH